jgi:hypothetical protein
MIFVNAKYFFSNFVALLRNKWLPFILGIPLFFCLHHYEGIVYDARLYLLQVVHNIRSDAFLNDPPFMFGNQDSYGFFTFFYGLFFRLFSIDVGSFWATFLGQSLLIFAAIYFILSFVKMVKIRLYFTPLLLCFIIYSGFNMPNDHIFFWRYIEGFNVSRLFSLAFAIWGLAALFRNNKYISLIVILLGTFIHPITAGWCFPLWLFMFYPKTQAPITIFAFVFPLTYLLQKGPFDIYPNDWGNCTHDHPITYLMLWREIVAVAFFGFIVPRFTKNEKLLKFSKATFLVMLIGFFWSATGGVAKHIFIYQVQTWRIEWLFFILTMPVLSYLIYEQIQHFHHKQDYYFSSCHISLFFTGFSILMPAPCSGTFLIALVLLMIPEKCWNLKLSLAILSALCIFSAGVQELIKNLLFGAFKIKVFNLSDLLRLSSNLHFIEFLWVIGIIIGCLYKVIKNKEDKILFCSIMFILFVYLEFPQFQLLPVVLFGFILFYQRLIKFKLFFLILLLGVGDSLFNTELRETDILIGFPRQILKPLFYALPIVIGLSVYFFKVSESIRKAILIAVSVILAVFAFYGYDKRTPSVKKSEAYLDMFREKTIFPQIEDRGKMFYYVLGDYVDESRTQFLTGSYFSETTPIGEALFKKQFEEERKRLNYIFFKEQRNFIARRGDWRQFVKDSLSHKNILLDRVSFLCSINEITHFVSNLRLKELEKQDSYKMNENETIYLYGCSNATN